MGARQAASSSKKKADGCRAAAAKRPQVCRRPTVPLSSRSTATRFGHWWQRYMHSGQPTTGRQQTVSDVAPRTRTVPSLPRAPSPGRASASRTSRKGRGWTTQLPASLTGPHPQVEGLAVTGVTGVTGVDSGTYGGH
ncbi:hypothetical protein P280DRAFT_8206 [Massarina eburnea CBS 473.64]|uniref:Uncharacterized protein n=1 Tax=Massarina eburnea CBS 473.64 TaxID=1395130 RepID=A0A6A6SGA1_9PLEO|nr:hypothetical protein P280DRAFT_8206 [Massarina eburnea CBS 473.64]